MSSITINTEAVEWLEQQAQIFIKEGLLGNPSGRPIIQLINDHPDNCACLVTSIIKYHGSCSWPEPNFGEDLDDLP